MILALPILSRRLVLSSCVLLLIKWLVIPLATLRLWKRSVGLSAIDLASLRILGVEARAWLALLSGRLEVVVLLALDP